MPGHSSTTPPAISDPMPVLPRLGGGPVEPDMRCSDRDQRSHGSFWRWRWQRPIDLCKCNQPWRWSNHPRPLVAARLGLGFFIAASAPNCPLRRAELLEPVAVGPDEFEDAAVEFARSV